MARAALLRHPRPETLLTLLVAFAALLATPAAGQTPACADALRADASIAWVGAALIAADLTLDGVVDAAYWRVEGEETRLLIGACEGEDVARRWRYAFDLPDDCPPAGIGVEAASLLLEEALVERTCSGERSASECAHLRRENERRRALMDAGGRALRVAGPSCTVGTLRWSPEMDGFMWIRR